MMKKRYLVLAVLVFVGVLTSVWYMRNTYSSEVDVEDYLKQTGTASVSEIEDGLFLDGQGTDTAVIFYPGAKVEYTSYLPLFYRLAEVNRVRNKTIVMVTHDAGAASYCSRILFIQDGQLFHELRRNVLSEPREAFYERIVTVIAQLGGGSAHVL